MASFQQEYDEAMFIADIASKQLERRLSRVMGAVARVTEELDAGHVANARNACQGAVDAVKSAQTVIQARDLTLWRQERQEADKARSEQQQVLTQKLAAAKALLLDAGWEREALEEHLKANAPTGRALARRSFREREARKRKDISK
jgi:hypothetical protein